MAAELKRLRRENEVLRQEREILEGPRLFSPRREVDEVQAHRCGEEGASPSSVCARFLMSAQSGYFAWRARPASPTAARRPGAAGPCPLGLPALERELRQPAHDPRAQGSGPERWAAPHGPADARERAQGAAAPPVQTHHRQPARLSYRSQPLDQDFSAERPTRNGTRISPTSGPARAGSTWPWSSICLPGGSWAGRSATACTRNWRSRHCGKALAIRRPGEEG